MGLRYEEVGQLYLGEFRDLFEEHKKYRNAIAKRDIYRIDEAEPVADPDKVLR